MDVSLIIPCHNEEDSFRDAGFIPALDWVRENFRSCEVIVVDDGSRDSSSSLARGWADRVIEQDHRGKAFALQAGFSEANGERVFWADADWSVPAEGLAVLDQQLSTGYDYVFASRGWSRPGSPLHRWLGSCIFTAVIQQTFDWSFRDTQCGLKGASRAALRRIQPGLVHFNAGQEARFAGTDAMFDIECLLVCRKLGLRVAECPARWLHFDNRQPILYRALLRQIYHDFLVIRRHYRAGRYNPPPHPGP